MKDPKKLLTQCISNLFKKNQFDSVAVTGTNGKSSIANFYLQILNLCNVKCASIGTLGIDDGKKVRKLENTTVESCFGASSTLKSALIAVSIAPFMRT